MKSLSGRSSVSDRSVSGSGSDEKKKTKNVPKNFIVSDRESKVHAGYPKFGSGVIKERGFPKMTPIPAKTKTTKKATSRQPYDLDKDDAEEKGKEKDPEEEEKAKGFGLKISVAPEGCADKSSAAFKGSVLTFDEAVKSLDGKTAAGDNPKLYMFEAMDGSKVFDGVLKSFVLPNGHKAHFYFSGKAVSDPVDTELSEAPPRPANEGDARSELPVANVMHELSLPKLDLMTAFKPRPALPKPPEYTELPDGVGGDGDGDGNDEAPHLQVLVTSQRITKQVTYTEREVPPPPKPPWKIHTSVFAPRQKDTDCKAFFNTESHGRKCCTRDWERLTGKEKFTSALQREAKATGSSVPVEEQIAELFETVVGYYPYMMSIFTYYAALSISGVFHLHLNQYTQCLEEAMIPDPESKACRKSDCDTLFILCNFVENKDDKQLKEVNDDHALMRYEFVEVLIRLSCSKYGKGYAPEGEEEPLTLSGALRQLFTKNILPNLPVEALQDPNDFRRNRLYFEVRKNTFFIKMRLFILTHQTTKKQKKRNTYMH